MTSKTSGNVKMTRCHLKEIALQPSYSTSEISIKVIVDDLGVYTLPPSKESQMLNWTDLSLPCDIGPNSQLTIELTETDTVDENVGSATFSALDMATNDSLSIHCSDCRFTVKVDLMSKEDAEQAYSSALSSVQQTEGRQGIMEKAGNIGIAFKTLLSFGSTMAELDPTGSAKVAFAICTQALKRLEEQDKQDVELNALIENLSAMTPSVEMVKDPANANLVETLLAMVNLIEDASIFILEYGSRGPCSRTIRSVVDSTTQGQIQALVIKFQQLREEFDTGVLVQNVETMKVNDKQIELKNLKPVVAGYNPSKACLPGTRINVNNEVLTWALGPNMNAGLAWIQGPAGVGKSSIAASVCQKLDEQRALAASFFCKRDNAELRDPRQVLTNIVYGLAAQFKPYSEALVSAIRADPEMLTRHIQLLYDGLLAKPLESIKKEDSPASNLIVVVDALDECGDNNTRKELLTCLRWMSQAVAWLKIIVTSRPDPDIQEYFRQGRTSWFTEWNVLSYDAHDDIRIFIQNYLGDMLQIEGWPQNAVERLSDRSGGLFIWARMACKFIRDGYDKYKRLEQVLAGQRLTDSVAELDALYTTIVKSGMMERGEDNLALKCLGVIAVTATRTPLSVVDLAKLLGGRIPLDTLNQVFHSLGSVLYSDHELGGAIRVSHSSFIDYITSPSRAKELCIHLDEQNTILATCCLETLKKELKFNICELETSHMFNCDVPNLEARAQAAVGPHLNYSCLYWSSHLVKAQTDLLEEPLRNFLFDRALLYWLETLSLLGRLSVAPSSLLGVSDCVSDAMEEFRTYSHDAYRFVMTFYDAVSKSAPHLYLSALAFAPVKSEVAQRMRPYFPNIMNVTGGADKGWTPFLLSMWVSSAVYSVAFSPDGRRILSGSEDDTVRIWDAETGNAVLEPLRGHSDHVMSVAFSPDGQRILSGSSDNTIRVWDADTGEAVLQPLRGHSGYVTSVAFSPNGRHIVSGSFDKTVRIWDAETGDEVLQPLRGHSSWVRSVVFSPDGRRIVSGSNDNTVWIWDAETGDAALQPLRGHSDHVTSVAFSPDGRRIVSGSEDNTVRIWDAETGDAVLQPLRGHSDWVQSVVFSPDSRRIVSGSEDSTVRIWDAETGDTVLEPLRGHTSWVRSVAFSSDGRRILSGSNDNTVRIWDAVTGHTELEPLQGHSDWVRSVAFSPNGRHIVSGSGDETMRIWDADTGDAVLEPLQGHFGSVLSVDFSPDGQRILSGSDDYTVRIWDAQTGNMVLEPVEDHYVDVLSVAFSPDGRRIVLGSADNTVWIWDEEMDGAAIKPLRGHSGYVTSVAFSPNGRHIVSGSFDKTVRIWDVETGGALLQPLRGHSSWVRSVAFCSDGRRIASGSNDKTVRIWDAETGEAELQPLRGHSDHVTSVAFSPDGRCVVSGSYDKTVRLWDAETGNALYEPLQGHSDYVLSVSFSPNGRHIASGSRDNTVRIWDVEQYVPVHLVAQQKLPGTRINLFASNLDTRGSFASTSSQLARHINSSGWSTTIDGGLLLWLPSEFRQPDDSLICISTTRSRRQLLLDFSKFVHGSSWSLIASV